jgi:hypothetical protein
LSVKKESGMDIRRQVTMAANRVISSIQGDQVPVVGRRPRRTRVIGTILVAGLILGMLAVPVGSVSAELVVDPCLTCVSERTIGASAARHTALAAFYAAADGAAAVRFSDSGAAALLAAGDELASPAAAAAAAWDSAMAAFYAAEHRPAAVAIRHNDSGVAAFLAARSEASVLADAARYSGLAAFHAAAGEAAAVSLNVSGAPAAGAADARYDALAAFYAAEYRPALVAQPYNDSGVAVAFAAP